MITSGAVFEQAVIEQLMACDPVVQEYRSFFRAIRLGCGARKRRKWSVAWRSTTCGESVCESAVGQAMREAGIHHRSAFLFGETSATGARTGLSLGCRPRQPYGIDVKRSVPSDRWLRHKQQTLPNVILQALFQETVHALQVEIPELGETVAIDTKHIYAWVKENNPREFVKDRYDPERQPSGDADCRLGVKRSSNQDDGDGQVEVQKEYLWGYG